MDKNILFTPIHCGYQLKEIYFFDNDSPIPVLLYITDILLVKTIRVFIPDPYQYELEPKVFHINEGVIITAANSEFSTQYFKLIPNSIYANNQDKILGIISPYDDNPIDIETEPYCKIIDDRFETYFNLWNSIDKTE